MPFPPHAQAQRHASRTQDVARGTRDKRHPGYVSTVVRLDEETFAAIRQRAIAQRTSFGEQVRTLLEWGLETERQGDGG
jgi:hypothetical protein